MPPEAVAPGSVPRWGADKRERIALGIVEALRNELPRPLAQSRWCDLGCGSGLVAAAIAPHVASITGLDPESWPIWGALEARSPNLRLATLPAGAAALPDGSMDAVICNQVYEHAQDPQALIRQIERLLAPGGVCYFAGPNLLFPIEPHTLFPFLHWLPRKIGLPILRAFGSKAPFDAYSKDWWTLRRWLSAFEVTDLVPRMMAEPARYGRTAWPWRLLSWIPRGVFAHLAFLSPGFVFLLRKPAAEGDVRTAVRQRYDRIAADGPYAVLAPHDRGGRKSRYVASVFEQALTPVLANLSPRARVLDFGAGTGLYTRQAAALCEHYVGADISQRMLQVARAHAGAADFVAFDGRRLPFPDGAFSGALARETLCYVPELAPVLAELRRVIEPGGWLALLDQVSENPAWQRHPQAPDQVKRSYDEWRAAAEAAGFVVEAARVVRRPRWPLLYLAWSGLVPLSGFAALARLEIGWHRRFSALRTRRWQNVLFVLRRKA